MKNIWKWILGIVIVLVVIAATGFIASGFYVSRSMRVDRFDNFRPPQGEGFDRNDRHGPGLGFDHIPIPRDYHHYNMPKHGYRGFGGHGFGGYGYISWPLMFFGGLLRLFLPLAVLVAVGYFAYKKGKKDGAEEVLASSSEIDS
jgi:hypothetical protein